MPEDKADAFLRMIRRVPARPAEGLPRLLRRRRQDLSDAPGGPPAQRRRASTSSSASSKRTAGRRSPGWPRGWRSFPGARQEYHGIAVEEMDVEAILARKPQVALIDELAHTNVPGSRNAKTVPGRPGHPGRRASTSSPRSTSSISRASTTSSRTAVGVKVRERLPDSVLAEADQIVDVDLATEDLRKRLEEGKIYPAERIETALANFFTTSNLEKLRELTLRELASQIDLRRREDQGTEESAVAGPGHGLPELARAEQREAAALSARAWRGSSIGTGTPSTSRRRPRRPRSSTPRPSASSRTR